MEMEDKDIIQLVYDKLHRANGWFTTKLDATYFDADVYYDLDKYGDLTEKGQKQVIKDVEQFIGDGAIDYTDAVDIWFDKAYGNNQIAGEDCLLTKFEPKQVVSQISAYECKTESKLEEDVLTPIPNELKQQDKPKQFTDKDWNHYYNEFKQSREEIYNGDSVNKIDFLKTDSEHYGFKDLQFTEETYKDDIDKVARKYADNKKRKYMEIHGIKEEEKELTESEFANEDLLNDFTQYVANNAEEIKDGVFEVEVPASLGYDKILNPDMLRKGYMKVKKLFNLDNGNTSIIFENKEIKEERVHKQLSTGDVYKNQNGVEIKITDVDKEHLLDGEPQVTYLFGGNTTNRNYRCYKMSSVVSMLNQNGYKLQESKKIEENAKTRLKEENNKSQNAITDKIEDSNFDEDSNEGKMILKTSELFNKLSDKGYDVQVSFDNGESTSNILLGQQGGQISITITDAELKLKAYVSGNFELTEDVMDKLQNILEVVNNF